MSASIFLLLGILVYLFFYPAKFQTLTLGIFQINVYKVEVDNPLLLGFIYAFTSYSHAVFMPIYSVLIMDQCTDKSIFFWAVLWGVVDSLFEVLQLIPVSEGNLIKANTWGLERINRYFETGSFDVFDIVFIWLGVLSVFYLWKKIKEDITYEKFTTY